MSEHRKSSRRDFLRGKPAVDAVSDIIESGRQQAESTPPQQAESAKKMHTIRYSRRAMACEFEVLLNAGEHLQGSQAAVAALDLVDQLEDQLSVYRPESEVSELNREADDSPIRVEADLFDLLQTAKQLYQKTDGAFDITSGPLSKIWGFHRRQGSLPPALQIEETLQQIGSHHFALDEQEQTIQFFRPDIELNLGAIGKGFALDCCAELMAESGVLDYMIHGGNSSILAQGNEATGEQEQTGWAVGVFNPLRPGKRFAQIHLQNAAMGTSGSGTQFFRHEGKRYGHILDPRTGWPAEGILSTTVVAPSATLADALATAFYVMGIDAAMQYCQSHPELALMITTAGKKEGSVNIQQIGFPEGMLEIL